MCLRVSAVGLAWFVSVVAAQSEECFSAGAVIGAVFATALVIAVLLAVTYFLWRVYWKGRKGKHLVLVTDPEKGDEYAFDNPGFKEGTPTGRTGLKEDKKQIKWQNWAPVTSISATDKPRALDDSVIGQPLMNVVPLRSHDFTGLGFNICGNMRDGIFVKDVLHRGPAYESGRIASGDRIESIKISMRHMVFEDALTILSYASPYEVQLEVENGSTSRPSTLLRNKRTTASPGPAERICHPFFRSHSITDLMKINKSSSPRRANDSSNNMDISNGDLCKPAVIDTSPIEKMQKVGVRVLPPSTNAETMKIEAEKTQNARNSVIESGQILSLAKKSPSNNIRKLEGPPTNILANTNQSLISSSTKSMINDFDEIDLSDRVNDDKHFVDDRSTPSPNSKESNVKSLIVKSYNNLKEKLQNATLKSDKENEEVSSTNKVENESMKTLNIKLNKTNSLDTETPEKDTRQARFEDNIDEIPEEVQNAGRVARNSRKSVIDDGKNWDRFIIDDQKETERRNGSISGDSSNGGDSSSQKKNKRKAPLPPAKQNEEKEVLKAPSYMDEIDSKDSLSEKNNSMDSVDTDSEQDDKSGNTIELNSSHITGHNAPDSETSRKTASLGDLSRIGNNQPIVVLERAVSLDLGDGTPGGIKKRKAPLPPQEEFLDDGGLIFNKETLTDPSLHTRLKHSFDFGRLEDAVKFNDNISDEESDPRVSESSTPEIPVHNVLISSTPLMQNIYTPSSLTEAVPAVVTSSTVVNTSPSSPTVSSNKSPGSVHISSCSWDLSVPDSTADQFVTAVNGSNTEEDEDTPPELPTSPIPTYVTEIQVVTANKDSSEGNKENGLHDIVKRDDVFPQSIPEMSSFMSLNNVHRQFSTFNNPFSRRTEINIHNSNLSDDLSSLPSLSNLSDTMICEINQVSLSQPNSLDPVLTGDTAFTIKDLRPSGQLIFSNENMSDEQILALKSSPEPILVDTSQGIVQVSKPVRSNVSVTSIRAGSSRIPVRAIPEPSQCKTKKDNFVSFSSLNVSPNNDKRSSNGSAENGITQIVLESQK